MPGPVFLTGEAVDLRTFEEEDVPFVHGAVNDHRVWRSLGGQVTPTSLATERRFFEQGSRDDETVEFVVTRREAGHDPPHDEVLRLGVVELNGIEWDRGRAEVAFWIAPDHQSGGYGRDALETLTGYAFDELGLHKLIGEAFATNEASMHVLEAVGFEREGRFREGEYVDGEWIDVVRYGLLAGDRQRG